MYFNRIAEEHNPFYTEFHAEMYNNFTAWPIDSRLYEKRDFQRCYPHFYVNCRVDVWEDVEDLERFDAIECVGVVKHIFRGRPHIEIYEVDEVSYGMDEKHVKSAIRADAYYLAGKFERAAKLYERALDAKVPGVVRADLNRRLGDARYGAKQFDSARNAYKRALRDAPKSAVLKQNVAAAAQAYARRIGKTDAQIAPTISIAHHLEPIGDDIVNGVDAVIAALEDPEKAAAETTEDKVALARRSVHGANAPSVVAVSNREEVEEAEEPKAAAAAAEEEAAEEETVEVAEEPKAEKATEEETVEVAEEPKAEETTEEETVEVAEEPKVEETTKEETAEVAEEPKVEETTKEETVEVAEEPKAEETTKEETAEVAEEPKAEETTKEETAEVAEEPKAEEATEEETVEVAEEPKAEKATEEVTVEVAEEEMEEAPATPNAGHDEAVPAAPAEDNPRVMKVGDTVMLLPRLPFHGCTGVSYEAFRAVVEEILDTEDPLEVEGFESEIEVAPTETDEPKVEAIDAPAVDANKAKESGSDPSEEQGQPGQSDDNAAESEQPEQPEENAGQKPGQDTPEQPNPFDVD